MEGKEQHGHVLADQFIENDIGENFLLYETAKEIWDATRKIYSNNENTTKLFEIGGFLHNLRQRDLPVIQYFNIFTCHWRQLDMFETHDWKFPTDGDKYKKIVEKKRLYKFLLGLNKNLDEVGVRILGMKPLPNIQEAFSEVRSEESRKMFMMASESHQSTAKSSTLATRGLSYQPTDNRQIKGSKEDRGVTTAKNWGIPRTQGDLLQIHGLLIGELATMYRKCFHV